MRLACLLHGGDGLTRGVGAAALFDAAIHTGAAVLNLPADEDHVIIDYAALTADSLFDDLDEAEVLLTRMNGAHATGLIVAGRIVMQDGRLTNVDFEAARRRFSNRPGQTCRDCRRSALARGRSPKRRVATTLSGDQPGPGRGPGKRSTRGWSLSMALRSQPPGEPSPVTAGPKNRR